MKEEEAKPKLTFFTQSQKGHEGKEPERFHFLRRKFFGVPENRFALLLDEI